MECWICDGNQSRKQVLEPQQRLLELRRGGPGPSGLGRGTGMPGLGELPEAASGGRSLRVSALLIRGAAQLGLPCSGKESSDRALETSTAREVQQ